MNGKSTRTNLDAEPEGSRTDWSRLKILDDAAIHDAIASDPDAYEVDQVSFGRAGASYRYVVFRSPDDRWQWQLTNSEGEVIAGSPRTFASRLQAELAIAALREAMLGAVTRAA